MFHVDIVGGGGEWVQQLGVDGETASDSRINTKRVGHMTVDSPYSCPVDLPSIVLHEL